jgi:hypothetical protein
LNLAKNTTQHSYRSATATTAQQIFRLNNGLTEKPVVWEYLFKKIPRVELEDPCTEVFPRVTKKVKVARKWTPEQREAARLRMKAQWEAGVIKNRHLEKALEGAYDD